METEPSPGWGFRSGDWELGRSVGGVLGGTGFFCSSVWDESREVASGGASGLARGSMLAGTGSRPWEPLAGVAGVQGIRWVRDDSVEPGGRFFFQEEAKANPWSSTTGETAASTDDKSWSHWGSVERSNPFSSSGESDASEETGLDDPKKTCEDDCWEAPSCMGKDGLIDLECVEKCQDLCDEMLSTSGDSDVVKDIEPSRDPFVDTGGLPHGVKPGDLPLSDEDWELEYDPGIVDFKYAGTSPVPPPEDDGLMWAGTIDKPEILMEIPAMDEGDCPVSGGPDNCWTPLLDHQNVSDFNSLDVEGLGENLVVSNLTESTELLVRTAWALIKFNYDLVEWSLCWYFGTESGGYTVNGLRRHIWADGVSHPLVEVKGDETRKAFKGRFDWLGLAGHGARILFPLEAGGIGQRYVLAWDMAYTDEDRMCAAVDLAATLLHETIHTLGVNMLDEPGDCDLTYLIENNFRWAMFQRYAHATEGACCGTRTGVSTCFMSHVETYLGEAGCFL